MAQRRMLLMQIGESEGAARGTGVGAGSRDALGYVETELPLS